MKTKNTQKAIAFGDKLVADASGAFPTEIEIAHTGSWRTPWHGNFDLTVEDFNEAVDHFNAGVYRVNGTEPLTGTLDHLGGDSPAAYRINSVYVVGDRFMASVTWTALGKEKLERDEYRYTSFEFHTRAQPFINPEDENEVLVNVLTGATLTNDPLMKRLKPVLASARSGSNNEEGEDMDLAAIRAKKLEDLSDQEKAFLEEHKTELTDEERTAFEISLETDEEKTAREAQEAKDAEEAQAKAEADRKAAEEQEKLEASALKNLSLKDLKKLQADAKAGREAQEELQRTRLTASVKAHVDRGAIKSDQLEAGVDLLMASSEANRAKLTSFLEALPSDARLQAEAGHGKNDKDDQDDDIELTPEEISLAEKFGNDIEAVKEFKKQELEASKA